MAEQAWEFIERGCNVCGGTNFRLLGYHGGDAHRQGKGVKTRIVKCRTCGLIFPNPMPHPDGPDVRYADVSGYFEEIMQASDETHRAIGDGLARDAERLLGRKGKFLDVGCGRGGVVWAAAQRGWDAEGCDISEAFVRYATEVTGVRVRAAKVEDIGYPEHYLLEHTNFSIEQITLYAGTTPVPNRGGGWGTLERIGIRFVGFLARSTGRNPYMYAWPGGTRSGLPETRARRAE